MNMRIYIYDNYYEQVLDNTLMHIHSCGSTTTLCMSCKNIMTPKNMNEVTNNNMQANAGVDTSMDGNFFFFMCAPCRTEAQERTGKIVVRSEQRRMVEDFLMSWSGSTQGDMDSRSNPYNYANVYVVSVENGVEIILLVANMNGVGSRVA